MYLLGKQLQTTQMLLHKILQGEAGEAKYSRSRSHDAKPWHGSLQWSQKFIGISG